MPSSSPWWRGERGEWYVVAQFVILGLLAAAPWLPAGNPAWPPALLWPGRGLGAALLLAGGLLSLAGVLHLGSNLSVLPHPLPEADLVRGGAYGLVRHPIYSGLILGGLGWALVWGSSLALLVAVGLGVFFDAKSRREERALAARFPDYAAYQRQVKKLIPFVY